LLTTGYLFPLSCVLVIAGIAHELFVEYRRHAIFLMLVTVGLAFSRHAGAQVWPAHHLVTGDELGRWLIAVTTTLMYFSSAYRKATSKQFRTGRLLAQLSRTSELVKPLVRYPEYLPSPILTITRRLTASQWRALAMLVIAVEFALPFGLLSAKAWPIAFITAVLMHTAFTLLLPLRLVPFTMACIGALLVFHP